jgi:hypothetical protein
MKTVRAKPWVGSLQVLALIGTLLSFDSKADSWTFIWIGASARGWTVVQGTAVPKSSGDQIHFDMTGTNSAKYIVDAQLNKDGTAEAGLAGVGDAYGGVTILKGKLIKKDVGSGCHAEMLQVQNDYNTLSIGRFGGEGCK